MRKWDAFQTINYPYGHCILTGYMGLRPKDPDTLAYEAVMERAYGRKRMEEILAVNIHHVLIYPGLSVQSPLQQPKRCPGSSPRAKPATPYLSSGRPRLGASLRRARR